MRLALRLRLGACIIFCTTGGSLVSPESSAAVAAPLKEALAPASTGQSPITEQATCSDWVSWVPPKTAPALVMQVVSEDYVDLERNFMRMMERNSVFTRHNMYLMCMDDASVRIFASLGIRCVPLVALPFDTVQDLWRTRVRALSCLVMEGYDVIMSDSDALWLRDPMEYFSLPDVRNSSVVASRGRIPHDTFNKWGTSMCMGFILFRATGPGMDMLLTSMALFVLNKGDDQVAANKAVYNFSVVWDEDGDMRYVESTGLGRGTIEKLHGDDGPFVVTLLPHSVFTRQCHDTSISNETVVAHCALKKEVGWRISWMQRSNLWLLDSNHL